MTTKILKKKAAPELQTQDEKVASEPEYKLQTEICGAWAFILAGSLNAFCRQDADHEGPHNTEINVLADPQAQFTITWTRAEVK